MGLIANTGLIWGKTFQPALNISQMIPNSIQRFRVGQRLWYRFERILIPKDSEILAPPSMWSWDGLFQSILLTAELPPRPLPLIAHPYWARVGWTNLQNIPAPCKFTTIRLLLFDLQNYGEVRCSEDDTSSQCGTSNHTSCDWAILHVDQESLNKSRCINHWNFFQDIRANEWSGRPGLLLRTPKPVLPKTGSRTDEQPMWVLQSVKGM